MIAAALIAASVLAPGGVTATIQGGPVCLPVTAQLGHSYPLTIYVQGGSLQLTVGPAHGPLERSLHQVPSSWVHFSSNPAGTGQDALTLAIPGDAAPGAYWSDITGTTQTQPEPGQVTTGAAATAALVFTVGPSATPPPPCDALTLAYSTGKFPPWPTPAFATSSWKQVFARQRAARPAPGDTCPTATAGPAASAAPSYCPGAGPGPQYAPASPAASPVAYSTPPGISKDWPGWLILGAFGAFVLYKLLKLLRIL